MLKKNSNVNHNLEMYTLLSEKLKKWDSESDLYVFKYMRNMVSDLESPMVIAKFPDKTSQGKVYVMVDVVSRLQFVVKINAIEKNRSKIWFNNTDPIFVVGYSRIPYRVVSDCIIDALIMSCLSTFVERKKIPHFPFCFAIQKKKFELSNKQSEIKTSILIFSEKIDSVLNDILQNTKNAKVWLSLLFQISIALSFAYKVCRFVHNDLHSGNILCRKVDTNSCLWYRDQMNNYYKVPTYGHVIVIIDFGRSSFNPKSFEHYVWSDDRHLSSSLIHSCKLEKGIVSSEFIGTGGCSGLIPDNPSVDVIRILSTFNRWIDRVDVSSEKKLISKIISSLCVTDSGLDIIDKLKHIDDKTDLYYYYIDRLPRTDCHNSSPIHLFHKLKYSFKTIKANTLEDVIYDVPFY